MGLPPAALQAVDMIPEQDWCREAFNALVLCHASDVLHECKHVVLGACKGACKVDSLLPEAAIIADM